MIVDAVLPKVMMYSIVVDIILFLFKCVKGVKIEAHSGYECQIHYKGFKMSHISLLGEVHPMVL